MKINVKSVLLASFVFLTAVGCDKSTNKLSPNMPVTEKIDKIRNVATPRIEILFVVDDSGSMHTHQDLLAKNIELFTNEIKFFGFLDYRIGVITSSIYSGGDDMPGKNGNLIADDGEPIYVDRNTRDGENLLRERIMVGTGGSASEVFLQTTKMALDPARTLNAGFYRQNSYIAVFFITDAEDQGAVSAQQLYDELLVMKKGDTSKVLSYGAIVPTNSSTDCSRDDYNTPKKIEKFIELTNGSYFDLCDPSYGSKLAAVAKDLAGRVARTVYLSVRPRVETIRVTYGTQVIPNDPKKGWMYNARTNSIMFGEDLEFSIQPEGTDLDVTFLPAEDIVSGGRE